MPNYTEFVNSQISFHEAMAEKFKAIPTRQSKHTETAASFRGLLDHLVMLESGQAAPTGKSPRKSVQLALNFDEIEGLPAELIQELSVSDGDRTDFTILKIIESAGGIASLDRILVGLFKETSEIMKRSTLTSKVYRMSQKSLIYSVPNKKGVYSTEELSEDEVEALLN